MKLNFKYMIAVSLFVGATGCDDKLETFEVVGSVTTPTAIAASAVNSEALPGQIKLSWEVPSEGTFDYLQIKYHDPLTKEEVCKIASVGTTEVLIDDTRARFGDYSFFFQTFNAAHQGSQVTEVKAKSGAAPSTTTEKSRKEVKLTEDQLSTNAQEPSEGPIKNLIDGKGNTFFHTRWSNPQLPLPHYIQIDFKEAHEGFAIYYQNRTDNTWTSDGRPSVVDLQISNDGENWEVVSTLSGLPTKHSSEYTSDFVIPEKAFTHFRFNVIATSGNTKYFNLAEFKFYDVEVEVYDPETVPLD
jgi:hypothetical protein